MPRFEVEVFALDCTFSAASTIYAEGVAAYADIVYDDTAAAEVEIAAADAYTAAEAAADAYTAAERKRQLDAIAYLISTSEAS